MSFRYFHKLILGAGVGVMAIPGDVVASLVWREDDTFRQLQSITNTTNDWECSNYPLSSLN